MTVYVTDLDAYRDGLRGVGGAWRARLGKHFPAMALVGVAGLVEREARRSRSKPSRTSREPA